MMDIKGDLTVNYAQLGLRIKKFRLEQKMTQAAVSELAGINEKYLSRIEHGHERISLEVFVGIANALELDANLLLATELKALCSDVERETTDKKRLHLQVDSLSEAEARYFSECIRLKRELDA